MKGKEKVLGRKRSGGMDRRGKHGKESCAVTELQAK